MNIGNVVIYGKDFNGYGTVYVAIEASFHGLNEKFFRHTLISFDVLEKVEIVPKNNFYVFCKKGEKEDIYLEQSLNKVCAPIKKGEVVGKITVFKNGVEAGYVDLVCGSDVEKLNFFGYINEILKAW